MKNSKTQLFTASVLSVLLFYTLANGYSFFHSMFAGDSLLMIYQNSGRWEISLGRFVQPILVLLRGGIAAPFLISLLALLWISLSVYLVVDFLKIKKLLSIVLISAIMSCNITILSLNATFLSYLDFYLLALFLSILGVWLVKKETPFFFILGSISLSISLGIYQSYICVSIALVMIFLLSKMPELPNFKSTCREALKYLLSFIVAAIIYYVTWKIFQRVFDIWTADTYNGLASVGDYSTESIGTVIATTYQNVFLFFLYPETFITNTFNGISTSLFWGYLLRLCNVVILLMILFALLNINLRHKTSLWQKMVQLLIIAVFPLGINFVCFVSKGMEHSLMIYAFVFVYVLAIKITEKNFLDTGDMQKGKRVYVPWKIVLATVMILSWSNIVYSNQVYLKKDLQESAAQSMMTRIVYKIESMEGYIPGETPVAIAGNFQNSPCILDVEPFKEIVVYGMGKSVMTYPGTDYAFLSYVLNININFTQVNNQDEVIRNMPVYPAEGSVAYVDGILVVKVSE